MAELLLSKAQIVQLNRKDALDIISLLLNNDLGKDSEGKIGLDRIACSVLMIGDLYKTVTINLKRVQDLLAGEELDLLSPEKNLSL